MNNEKIVFRGGSRTNATLTPRAGKDTTASAGLVPGLSVEDTLEDALDGGNKKAQKLDLAKLKLPLAYFPDNSTILGGRKGHGVITPVNAQGQVDRDALEKWASARNSQGDAPHPLTQLVIDAITENNVRRT